MRRGRSGRQLFPPVNVSSQTALVLEAVIAKLDRHGLFALSCLSALPTARRKTANVGRAHRRVSTPALSDVDASRCYATTHAVDRISTFAGTDHGQRCDSSKTGRGKHKSIGSHETWVLIRLKVGPPRLRLAFLIELDAKQIALFAWVSASCSTAIASCANPSGEDRWHRGATVELNRELRKTRRIPAAPS